MTSTHRRTRRNAVLAAALLAALAGLSGCNPLDPSSTPTEQASPASSASPASAASPTLGLPSAGQTEAAPHWSFVVVRHADRADDGTNDPPLTEAGYARAARLADLMRPRNGTAVYATPFRRTQTTAAPTAADWAVPVTTYDPTLGANALIEQIQSQHPQGTVLIVGHSDTVPAIVSSLCQCQVGPIGENEFGNLFQVDLAADGEVLKAEQAEDY